MDSKEKPYKFVVRFPITLRNQIADAAKYYRRSMNSEIVARLEQSFSGVPSELRDAEIAPLLHKEIENLFGRKLNDDEQRLIRAYRRLAEDKQMALIELLN